jgi:hypothetical protein
VLSAFLLLSAATMGCNDADDTGLVSDVDSDSDSDSDTDSDTDTGNESPWTEKCSLDPSGAVVTAIEDSEMTDDLKLTLCECLEVLSDDWNTGLTELFENGSSAEVAAALSTLLECCYDEESYFDSPFSQTKKDELINRTVCRPTIIYKGVAFPDDDAR